MAEHISARAVDEGTMDQPKIFDDDPACPHCGAPVSVLRIENDQIAAECWSCVLGVVIPASKLIRSWGLADRKIDFSQHRCPICWSAVTAKVNAQKHLTVECDVCEARTFITKR